MNKETVCAVVRDLMPSYIEGMTELETNAFVEGHLADCQACREVRRGMLHVELPEERAQGELLSALRRARIHRRRRRIGLIAVLLLAAAVCLLPLPRRIDAHAQAVRWRAGAEGEGDDFVQVVLRGTYLDFLLRSDRFVGDIAIEGVEITQTPGALLPVRMDSHGMLTCRSADGTLQIVGFIVASPDMREFVIGLHEDGEGWSGDGGLVLTCPAEDRQSAVEAARRILIEQECSWLSEGAWEAGSGAGRE